MFDVRVALISTTVVTSTDIYNYQILRCIPSFGEVTWLCESAQSHSNAIHYKVSLWPGQNAQTVSIGIMVCGWTLQPIWWFQNLVSLNFEDNVAVFPMIGIHCVPIKHHSKNRSVGTTALNILILHIARHDPWWCWAINKHVIFPIDIGE